MERGREKERRGAGAWKNDVHPSLPLYFFLPALLSIVRKPVFRKLF